MLDIRFIREFKDQVEKNIRERRMDVSVSSLLELDERRREMIQKVEDLLFRRNENAKQMQGCIPPRERAKLVEEGRDLKFTIASEEKKMREVEFAFNNLLSIIPNLHHPDVPVSENGSGSIELRRVGEPHTFSFPIKDHVELGEDLNILDFGRAGKVTGARFYYLKNQGVLLDMVLQRYAMDFLQRRGFGLFITPDLARKQILEGLGFNSRGEESNIYNVEETDLCLVGTAEITLGGYYKDSVLDLSDKPILMAGLSHCFRREAGGAGHWSRGLYRVHQFTKVEMFSFCRPDQSERLHTQFLEIEEEFFKSLGIPYRVLDICSQDLGSSAYRKFDIEAWMPGRGMAGEYGEVTSTSNCTDYQSRRLKIRYKDKEGKSQYVHMINGTAVATSRAIIALLENGQQEDGSVLLPAVLVPYLGFSKIEMPKSKKI